MDFNKEATVKMLLENTDKIPVGFLKEIVVNNYFH